MTEATLLVISPTFHDYWRSIERAFTAEGYDVVTHCYDDFATFGAKAHNKLVYELADRIRPGTGTRRLSRDATAEALEVLRVVRPDVVLAIKCDVMADALWDEVDRLGATRVLWLYDELRRTHHDTAALAGFHAIASYSHHDVDAMCAQGLDAHHVALAFDPDYTAPAVANSDVVFVGARYPKREALLVEAHQRGVPIRAYGRDWSRAWADRARTWSWHRPDLPAHGEVSRREANALMAGATATLNIHGDQDGFTMRTFEAAGIGALQLVDRADVDEFYGPESEVIAFESVDEIVELTRRAATDPRWRSRVAEAARAHTLAEHTFVHRARQLATLWD